MKPIIDTIEKILAYLGSGTSFFASLTNAVLTLMAALLVWLIIKRVLSTLERKSDRFKVIQVRKELFDIFRNMSGLVLVWLVGMLWIRLFRIPAVEPVLHAAFVIAAAKPVKALILIALGYLERNLAERTETALDNIVVDLLSKFSGAIVYATALIIALDTLGVNVMPFIAGAGVMGVAVGFAAKDTLSNLIAGILLIIDRPFEVGDRIEVWSSPAGSASWGDVIEIGLRATRIKTTDNIVIVVPNNEIMMRDIVNYTSISSSIRVRVNIGIAYDADMEKAKALIIDAAQSADWILADPAPKVVVRHFGDSSVDLQLRVWIKNARRRMDTISYITDTVKTLFDANEVEIPFPKRDVTIVDRTNEAPVQSKKDNPPLDYYQISA